MRLELLKATVINRPFWFKVFSCGRIKDKTQFMAENGVNRLGPNEVPLSQLEEGKKKHEEEVAMKKKKRGG